MYRVRRGRKGLGPSRRGEKGWGTGTEGSQHLNVPVRHEYGPNLTRDQRGVTGDTQCQVRFGCPTTGVAAALPTCRTPDRDLPVGGLEVHVVGVHGVYTSVERLKCYPRVTTSDEAAVFHAHPYVTPSRSLAEKSLSPQGAPTTRRRGTPRPGSPTF